MNKNWCRILITSAALASTGLAQVHLVRGDVDSVQNTRTFVLKCTNVQLVSTTVNLQAMHDQARQNNIFWEMQVKDVSANGRKILDVLTAVSKPKILDMGNIRLGRSDRWAIASTPGSAFAIYMASATQTDFLPVGALGSWILGFNFFLFHQGIVPATGLFQFSFQPPNIPALVGHTFASQALIVNKNSTALLSNAECKEVRSK